MAATDSTTAATTRAGHALGLTTLHDETEIGSLPVEGVLPPWLAGSLVRTGPAKFETKTRSVNHWFDGLAMLHRYTFGGGEVSYANRFLHSKAWRAVEETGELGYAEFATDPCRSLFRRVATIFRPGSTFTDNGSVNVSRVGDEFVALTETPLPVVFDSQTLEAAGVAYEAPGHISTAHPHFDPERHEFVNFAAKLGPRSTYRFYGQRSRSEQRIIAKTGVAQPGYIHSFGLTPRYLILAEGPFVVDPLRLALSGRPYIENYRWKPERGGRFLVFERDSGRLRGTYETDAFFTFHHINAFERGNEVVVDLCGYDDASIIDALYMDNLRARSPGQRGEIPTPRRYTIGLDSGKVDRRLLAETDFELPRIDYRRCNGRPYRYTYGLGVSDGFLGRVVKIDVESGETSEWSEAGCWAGEPVFVPEPDADAEDAGVLLSVVLDGARETSFLLVLDAATLEERARAQVPHAVPFSFHGQFFGSE
jgi:beta,beta-carotene 9',10'-dioxygenase